MSEATVYQGQFGEFRIDKSDRLSVIIYRAGLMVAAVCFGIATFLAIKFPTDTTVLNAITFLYATFCIGLAVSLATIHIYLAPLHRLLQVFLGIGAVSSVVIGLQSSEPLALYVYNHPLTLFGVGFTFAALTGIYFKEGMCFNRLETKLLTPIVPALLLGHLFGVLPLVVEQTLLSIWAILFMVFAVRKLVQAIDPDIGDKSVFAYLKAQKKGNKLQST
ncbi:DUF2301 domain-containing membrane protein [Merismopedia glauca]|uniref:DUF2301 domain-containing membrane protein n=1 Tax=Merismopedia glauca CCAP 1448/3 TaxID=1296344 RepID=A0A2T1CAC9_9CYAN|nr:DUF2301 domain-containing membrane protein [Merismopedia glauca]PSB05230.1 hypothetical protein C7B64_00020 [Merismopedia glauca CCAP 1448/3]